MQGQGFAACGIDQIDRALQIGQGIDLGNHQVAKLATHGGNDGLNIGGKTGVIDRVHAHGHTAADALDMPIQVLQQLHHLRSVFSFFSEMRYAAMRSISPAGQPCSVDSVIERHTRGLIAFT